jgi:heptosyltransferase-2
MSHSTHRVDPFRLLVLAPNWLGDSVMATRLLDWLHGSVALPDGQALHICWAVRAPWVPLFIQDPRIDELVVVDRPGRHDGLKGFWHLGRDLSPGKYDGVILGPPSLRVAMAARVAGIPLRVGYRTDGRGFLLTHGVPPRTRGAVHFSEEMVELGKIWLGAVSGLVDASAAPPQVKLHLTPESAPVKPRQVPRLVLAPGATYGLAKTWPLSPALVFCRLCLEEGAELLLLGDAGSRSFAADLASGLSVTARPDVEGTPGLVDLTGRTGLIEVAHLLQQSDGFAGNDSGLMHLAGALGIPTVGVFGSSNPAWTAPQGPRARALAARGFPCQPCYRKTCNQPSFCLDTVTGQEVYQALSELRTRPRNQGAGS